MMDTTYGRALSWNCTNCHVTTDFSSDSRHDKLLARTMQQMTNAINSEYMPKIDPKDPPRATCMNCHRGVNIPSDSVDYRIVPPTAASRPPATTGSKPPSR
jgi:photosynthetic reaction center cytochrome c subunit